MRTRTYYGMGDSHVPRYDTVSRFFHWLMAILLTTSIALIELKGFLPKGHLKYEMGFVHIEIGLLILLLVGARIIWRTTSNIPPISPPLPHLQNVLAGAVHILLYMLMVSLPMLGVLALQAKGKAVELFLVTLPALVNEDNWLPYALTLHDYHELLGNVLIGAIVLHIVSAIFHHTFRKDNALKRMLPMLY